jgi:hypothetical protein
MRLQNRTVETGKLHWILMATLPNSGSTAFAKLLDSSPSVTLVTDRGEGQWLLPDLCADRLRWDPNHRINYERVHYVWKASVMARNPKATFIFDKSPPTLVRYEHLSEALSSSGKSSLISFSRNPLAICASWTKRYPPTQIAAEWEHLEKREMEGDRFYYKIGQICGKRMEMLVKAREISRLHVSYEEICEDPTSVTHRLSEAFPGLQVEDPEATILVKDYARQPLRNMNEEQLKIFSEQQRSAVLDGLSLYEDSIKSLGYSLS